MPPIYLSRVTYGFDLCLDESERSFAGFGKVWLCFFSHADPVSRWLCSLLFVLSSSGMMCTKRQINRFLSSKLIMPMASSPHLFSLAYVCCFLDYRQRVHSAPLLHRPSSVTPSQSHRNFSTEAPLRETVTSNSSNTGIKIGETADIKVCRRDF